MMQQQDGNVSVTGAISSTGGTIALTTGANGTLSISGAASVVTSGAGADISLSGATLTNAGNVSSNRDLIIAANNLANTGTMTTSRDLDVYRVYTWKRTINHIGKWTEFNSSKRHQFWL